MLTVKQLQKQTLLTLLEKLFVTTHYHLNTQNPSEKIKKKNRKKLYLISNHKLMKFITKILI